MKAFFIGAREYLPVLRLQEHIFESKIIRQTQVRRGEVKLPLIPDVNILVEHAHPVYTVGRRNTTDGLPPPDSPGAAVPVVRIKRGGGITYHGPGQVTLYPIANLQLLWKRCTAEKRRSPIEWFSEMLERSMIDTAADFGIPCHPFKTGVWADRYEAQDARKMGSIGLQMGSGWVSMHGAGFNVSADVSYFDHIIMCELPGKCATSVQEEVRLRGLESKASLPARELKLVARQLHHHLLEGLHQAERDVEWEEVVDLSLTDHWEAVVCEAVGLPPPSPQDHQQ